MAEPAWGAGRVSAHAADAPPEVERLRDEVWGLLTRTPRQLSPKWFYDTRGSELFEAITHQPEYYPTGAEQALLASWAAPWVAREQPTSLVELGAGSARKTRVLLDAMQADAPGGLYVPVDVSADFLEDTARTLRMEYPSLSVVPEVADLSASFALPGDLPRPALFALLGSTIGNFEPRPAARLLRQVGAALGGDDHFLMGADLRPGPGKSLEELEAAYNDEAGVTAAFNLNMLTALNREAGTDFAVDAFRHRAFYASDLGRVEMHLVADRATTVGVPGRGRIPLAPGETIRTEISCKYDRPTVEALFAEAGLDVRAWATDARARYALVLGGPS